MTSSRASTRRAALAAFLLFAAALFVVGPAEASRTTTETRSSLASTSVATLAPSPSLELVGSVESSPHFGFGENLGLLDPEAGPGGFVVFAPDLSRCELTYARNNPLKYVDPDGRSAVAAAVSLLAPLVNIPITPPQMVVLVGGSSIAAGRAIGGMTLGGTTIDERLTRLFTNWLAGPEQVDLGPLTLDRGGESPEAKYGREQHQAWDYGPGFEKEVRLPSGRRVDGLNPETREVRELKPDNPRAVRRGETQVQRYVKELEAKTREKWTGKVETYRRPKDNEDATKK